MRLSGSLQLVGKAWARMAAGLVIRLCQRLEHGDRRHATARSHLRAGGRKLEAHAAIRAPTLPIGVVDTRIEAA